MEALVVPSPNPPNFSEVSNLFDSKVGKKTRHLADFVDAVRKSKPMMELLNTFWSHAEAEQKHGDLFSTCVRRAAKEAPSAELFDLLRANLPVWQKELREKATTSLEESVVALLMRVPKSLPAAEELTESHIQLANAAVAMEEALLEPAPAKPAFLELKSLVKASGLRVSRSKLEEQITEKMSLEQMSEVGHLSSTLVSAKAERQAGVEEGDEKLCNNLTTWLAKCSAYVVDSLCENGLTTAVVEAAVHSHSMVTQLVTSYLPVSEHPVVEKQSKAFETQVRGGLQVQDALQSLKDMAASEPLTNQIKTLHAVHSAVHRFREDTKDMKEEEVKEAIEASIFSCLSSSCSVHEGNMHCERGWSADMK